MKLPLRLLIAGSAFALLTSGCDAGTGSPPATPTDGEDEVRLVTLDPGHFHAALVQQYGYEQVDSVVHVYAPDGEDVDNHLALVDGFNSRPDDPTNWDSRVYRGPDYLERMLEESAGNVMVVAGNNGRKIDYIREAVEGGMNVLADKPMVIVPGNFPALKDALELADEQGLLINDIMTERHAITSILQRELSQIPELFGELQQGTPDEPAITKESVHFFSKTVAGSPLIRPAWFFDVEQQGEAIVDVSTHLVDLILWQAFPEEPIHYEDPEDGVEVISARTWDTQLTDAQFAHVTNEETFPEYLQPYVEDDVLNVAANGEFFFTARGVHAKVSVLWGYENAEGGDTHFSAMHGTRSSLVIRQDEPQDFVATLYVEPAEGAEADDGFETILNDALATLGERYPGLSAQTSEHGWEIVVPDEHAESHEDHFTRVTEQYLAALGGDGLPEWERANLLTKYFITTRAYELSR